MKIQGQLFGEGDGMLRDKMRASLILSATGDALGWPTEFGRYPSIIDRRSGKKYLEEFVPWQKMVGGKFWGYREIIKEGEYSDDTQLALAVYRSIDGQGDFRPERFAHFELPLWLHYERGGGRTIKTAARMLVQANTQWSRNFFATSTVSYRDAGANGAAMRVLPIVLANVGNKERLFRDAVISSITTHGHPRAILASIIYAAAVHESLTARDLKPVDFTDYLLEEIDNSTDLFESNHLLRKWVSGWNNGYDVRAPFAQELRQTQNEARSFIKRIRDGADVDDGHFYSFVGALAPESKGSGISTVVAGIYLFLKYRDNPIMGLLTAVNSLGSDTDTIANFVGGLVGAHYGTTIIPGKFSSKLQDHDYLLKIGDNLFNIATGNVTGGIASFNVSGKTETYLKILAWELGLHEMFWDALDVGKPIVHPALGIGVIKSKRVEPLRRADYVAKLIEVVFNCGQTCVFHSRVSKEGEVSQSLAKETIHALGSLEKTGLYDL